MYYVSEVTIYKTVLFTFRSKRGIKALSLVIRILLESMNLRDVRFVQDPSGTVTCYIDNFSDDLKTLIRTQLTGIWSGFAESKSMDDVYSYEFTLESFLDRYIDKADGTQKGMIGELIAHVLINYYLNEYEPVSILKNKEERSIRKGFDIIYYQQSDSSIWYSEVKSGELTQDLTDSTSCSVALLNKAHSGIKDILGSKRSSLWESALIDAGLTIDEEGKKLSVKRILANDMKTRRTGGLKNVFLISVLFNDLADEVCQTSIIDHKQSIDSEGDFLQTLVIAVQKNTYDAVAQFLKDELASAC